MSEKRKRRENIITALLIAGMCIVVGGTIIFVIKFSRGGDENKLLSAGMTEATDVSLESVTDVVSTTSVTSETTAPEPSETTEETTETTPEPTPTEEPTPTPEPEQASVPDVATHCHKDFCMLLPERHRCLCCDIHSGRLWRQ